MTPPSRHRSASVEQLQIEHRRRLVAHWMIAPGSRVLEIGCGQGDLTEVLAEAVGPHGEVLAIDAGSRDEGAPITLGAATDALVHGPLGPRIRFQFECDLLDAALPPHSFDVVAMGHAAWYFASEAALRETLAVAAGLGPRLVLAEWDLEPRVLEQTPHLLAVLIQGVVGERHANVRTPLTTAGLRRVVGDAGWEPLAEATIDSRALPDADWEIAAARAAVAAVPDPSSFVRAQVELLEALAQERGNASLETYSLVAGRAPTEGRS